MPFRCFWVCAVPSGGAVLFRRFLRVFALLIGNAAARLARGLAGRLALAASAVLCALAQIARLDRLNMFHLNTLPITFCSHYNKALSGCQV